MQKNFLRDCCEPFILNNMKVYEKCEDFNLFLYGLQIPYSSRTRYSEIRTVWGNLNMLKKINKVNLKYPWKKYGVIYKKKGQYYYFCGFETSSTDKKDNLMCLKVEFNNFIEYRLVGNMKKYREEYRSIYSNSEISKRRCNILILEEYSVNFKWNKADSEILVRVPQRKNSR